MLGGEPRRAGPASATARSRSSVEGRRTCSCSTFSVRSREVMPLWMCSWPASALELLDPRLHVVPGDPLAGGDRVEVDALSDDVLVGLDDAVGHVDAEVALGLEHRDPELPLEHDLVLGRPDLGQVGAGVAGGEDVGDGHGLIVPMSGSHSSHGRPPAVIALEPRRPRRRRRRARADQLVRRSDPAAGTVAAAPRSSTSFQRRRPVHGGDIDEVELRRSLTSIPARLTHRPGSRSSTSPEVAARRRRPEPSSTE